MIGTLPMYKLAPLEYRLALDSALAILGARPTLLRCSSAVLAVEARQRISVTVTEAATAALWIEPDRQHLFNELSLFESLPVGTPLVIILSHPLARLLPNGQPVTVDLGASHTSVRMLKRVLRTVGFSIDKQVGFRTLSALVLARLGVTAALIGRPEIGDRLIAASRLSYCTTWLPTVTSTLGLLLARKEQPDGA